MRIGAGRALIAIATIGGCNQSTVVVGEEIRPVDSGLFFPCEPSPPQLDCDGGLQAGTYDQNGCIVGWSCGAIACASAGGLCVPRPNDCNRTPLPTNSHLCDEGFCCPPPH